MFRKLVLVFIGLSSGGIIAAGVFAFLVMAVVWLCFWNGDEPKEPDGTLVFSITREVAA